MSSSAVNGSIIYSVVTGKTQVSAFNGPHKDEIADLAAKVLNQIDLAVDTKKSYSSKGYTFNYVTKSRTAVLCVADEAFPRRLCFAFLERVSNEHEQKGKVSKSQLEQDMKYFSNAQEADKIRAVQKQVDDVKGIMMENIEKVLERGEKMEELNTKTASLEAQSASFHKSSKKLKCELIKKNWKLTAIIVGICLVIIIIIVVILVIHFK